MSGWPSGLRRQTQELPRSLTRVFWSTNVGVGSNPTSDKSFYYFVLLFFVLSTLKQRLENIHWCIIVEKCIPYFKHVETHLSRTQTGTTDEHVLQYLS